MAMNWQVFKTRALTALIFVVIMLVGLLWNQWSFLILFSVIHWGCWIEYQKLIKLIDTSYRQISYFHAYGIMLAGWALMLYSAGNIYQVGGVTLHAIGLVTGLILIFALPLTEILFSKRIIGKNVTYSILGLLYISLNWSLLISIRSIEDTWIVSGGTVVEAGWVLPIIVIVSIWINDTMAYITGSLIGKTPFSKVSPKKTIEGTTGGVILCVVTMAILAYYMQFPVMHVGIIATLAALAGTAGDLLESKLKRLANVKDSGHIMPGHGGFLDRFDSLLIAIPVIWVYVMFVVK